MTDKNAATTYVEVTKDGLADLKAELVELRDVKMAEVVDRVAKAREYGDLSENAEYHDAKEEQRLLETRISKLEDVIARAKVVKHTRSTTKVGIGSTIVVKKKGSKSPMIVTIVGEFEADPSESKFSSASPLGKAVLGKKKGDSVIVNAPAGEVEYTIEDIQK